MVDENLACDGWLKSDAGTPLSKNAPATRWLEVIEQPGLLAGVLLGVGVGIGDVSELSVQRKEA